MSTKKVTVKAADVNKNYVMIDPKLIIADEEKNPRHDYGDITELMNSIVENGIRNPLKGYEKDGKIILKDGHRRMRAVKLALSKGNKITRVPVILEQRPMNEEERTLEYIIFNDGKPLTMIEQSEVINRLLNFGWKVVDVVKKTGKARGYIDNLILLTKAPMKVQHYIHDGKISAHAVIQIMQAAKGNDEKVIKDVEDAIKAAKESGKEKATPKHVGTKEVKDNSFGKFYKWADEIASELRGKKGVIKERRETLETLLAQFENGRPIGEMISLHFLEKPAAVNSASQSIKEVTKPAEKKAPAAKTAAKKSSQNKGAKKAAPKKKK